MKIIRPGKKITLALTGLLLSGVNIREAESKTAISPVESEAIAQSDSQPIAQACPESWQQRRRYARVNTRSSDLRIRSTPGGRIIGSVPKGWSVVVAERSSTGTWTRISENYPSVSAPNLRNGWVATRFLQDLGMLCQKPMAAVTTPLLAAENSQQYTAQEDWTEIAERIVENSQR
ncbi:MAG: hypothetical protein SAJ12_01965 [Jaaginema sp. PMC 1079.18]|nr:hypothetical protein [Jaaginema sp. PMC 1080.18]MEC4849753.1 hypothetical protein [Jaaginema sp. PMC 1079.18]MEC4866617.1 hypothetical protein [Jaaginema sp. PMC 1078.18]